MPTGLLLVDKPAGITSHDVVARARKKLGTRKIGHAGTLDPFATGLLILGANSGTRLLHYLVGLDKQYQATIKLGIQTTTDDLEGETIFRADCAQLSEAAIDAAVKNFLGEQEQIPSKFSAVKISGKKAYELARAGEEFEITPRKVQITRFERVSEFRRIASTIEFDAVVECSSGTYIRALARDLGASLRVGGHLSKLRRTKIGPFDISEANSLESDSWKALSLKQGASRILPVFEISASEARDLVHGKKIQLDSGESALAACFGEKLVAILEKTGGSYRSLAVFAEESDD